MNRRIAVAATAEDERATGENKTVFQFSQLLSVQYTQEWLQDWNKWGTEVGKSDNITLLEENHLIFVLFQK